MTTKLALIGCGNAKNPGVLPAKDKYSSNYAGIKWKYGEVVCDVQRILSAKYGELRPETEIDDYDASLSKRHDSYIGDEAVQEWAEDVNSDILETVQEHDVDEVHILLGKDYREAIAPAIEQLEEIDVEIVRPFEGTSGLGEQMSELKDRTAEAQAQ